MGSDRNENFKQGIWEGLTENLAFWEKWFVRRAGIVQAVSGRNSIRKSKGATMMGVQQVYGKLEEMGKEKWLESASEGPQATVEQFLRLSTMDMLGWMTLCGGGLSCAL